MAEDIHETHLKIIAEQGGFDSAGGEKYLAILVSTNRYVRDVYEENVVKVNREVSTTAHFDDRAVAHSQIDSHRQ